MADKPLKEEEAFIPKETKHPDNGLQMHTVTKTFNFEGVSVV